MAQRQTAIVTGGAQGIGRGIVRRLLRGAASTEPAASTDAAATWNVVAVDLSAEGIADAAAVFEAEGFADSRLRFVQGDCADVAVAKAAVRAAVDGFGALHLLVNNCGGGGIGVPFLEQTPEYFAKHLAANLTSCYTFSHTAAPALIEARGSIVNIGSTRAVMSEPNSEPYAAAKGGVVGLTHAMAASLSGKVNVNCILPGWIDVSGPEWGPGRTQEATRTEDNEQHFSGRVGTPDDVAAAVVYVAGARFMCGQTLTLDGGMTRKMIYAE